MADGLQKFCPAHARFVTALRVADALACSLCGGPVWDRRYNQSSVSLGDCKGMDGLAISAQMRMVVATQPSDPRHSNKNIRRPFRWR